MKEEVWKDIMGYHGYQISSNGNIISKRFKNKIIKPNIAPNGYYSAYLFCNNKPKRERHHRLVALHFIPNPQNKPCINHINGVKTDNRVGNLEWVTYSENNLHACKIGLRSKESQKTSCKRVIDADGNIYESMKEAWKQNNHKYNICLASFQNYINRGKIDFKII